MERGEQRRQPGARPWPRPGRRITARPCFKTFCSGKKAAVPVAHAARGRRHRRTNRSSRRLVAESARCALTPSAAAPFLCTSRPSPPSRSCPPASARPPHRTAQGLTCSAQSLGGKSGPPPGRSWSPPPESRPQPPPHIALRQRQLQCPSGPAGRLQLLSAPPCQGQKAALAPSDAPRQVFQQPRSRTQRCTRPGCPECMQVAASAASPCSSAEYSSGCQQSFCRRSAAMGRPATHRAPSAAAARASPPLPAAAPAAPRAAAPGLGRPAGHLHPLLCGSAPRPPAAPAAPAQAGRRAEGERGGRSAG